MRDPRAVASSPRSRPERRGRRVPLARSAVASAVVVAFMTLAAGTGLAGSSTQIPSAGPTDLPTSIGSAVAARPTGSARVPQNPFLAPNPSQLHKDTWMSDTQPQSGPLGAGLRVWSTALTEVRTTKSLFFICGTGGFDRFGRYETCLLYTSPSPRD